MKEKYHVQKSVEYGCTVYQVINSSTGVVAYYDKDKMSLIVFAINGINNVKRW